MKSLNCLKGQYAKVIFAPILKIVECICELIVPFVVKAIIDEGLSADGVHYGETDYIVLMSLLVLGLALLGFGATMVTQYVASKVSTDFGFRLRGTVYRQINSLSSSELDRYGRSKALNLLSSDSFSLQNGLFMFMRLLVRAPFLTLGSIVCSFILNVYAGIAVILALALCAVVVAAVLTYTPKKYGAVQNSLDKLTSLGEDGIYGARVIRSFNKEADEVALFRDVSDEYRHRSDFLSRINALFNPLTFGLVNLAIVAVFYLGSFQFEVSGLSSGSIVAIMGLLTQSLTALIQFSRLVTSLSKAYASKKRLDAFLLLESKIADGDKPLPEVKEGEPPLPEVKEGEPLLEARQACLSYGGESLALDHVDFLLRRGESVGVIGGTGSGKSTLISLLMRFADPASGTMLYGGVPYGELRPAELRGQVALVLQKAQLFKGSVRGNVALRGEGEAELRSALRDSLSEEFVSRYPDGAGHLVEEGGANLSGGQRQRLLIARALCSGRRILILDDSTSALDYKSDSLVRANIRRREGLSTVIVSQRATATSIMGCDRIYVLDKGKVVGVGRHEELLESCPIYRQTYEAQVR